MNEDNDVKVGPPCNFESIIVGPNHDDSYGLNNIIKKPILSNKLPLDVKKLHPNGKLPTKSNPKDAGWDLYCVADDNFTHDHSNNKRFIVLPAKCRYRFKTGVAVKAPDYHMLKVEDRSGMGNKGITKFAGIIDETYTGELQVILYNSSDQDVNIFEGDRIAQFLVLPVPECEARWVDELKETVRGDKGFGSSGN